MKYLLSLLAIGLFCTSALAQQDQVLAPADTAGTINIELGDNIKRITNYQVKLNKLRNGTEGYRIEIYFGSDRTEAQDVMKRFKKERDSIACDLSFQNPYLRVQVGNFRSRVEAQKLYYELKKEFKTVIIVHVPKMDYPPLD
ncbi:MAG: SPOR domain-containing protein [Bacteroidetes bacterium]|nr:SPOR domain-containing protein [Bacteroidota bacterium]